MPQDVPREIADVFKCHVCPAFGQRTDAACLWATGTTWWQVPMGARCRLTGRLREGVVGKDVIIALCGLFNNDEVLNHAVEFVGDGIEHLSMDQRLSIANMTTSICCCRASSVKTRPRCQASPRPNIRTCPGGC